MPNLGLVFFALVMLFIIFRRGRSLLTRQPIRPTWMLVRMGIFVLLGTVVLIVSALRPDLLLGAVVGLAIGAAVGGLAFRLTLIEPLANAVYYTQNKYIGLAVFAVFLLRLAYKVALVSPTGGALGAPGAAAPAGNFAAQFGGDPLTTGVYFLLIGYYICYYALLLLRARQHAPSQFGG